MSRWIVSTLPPWLLLMVLIVVISGGSVVAAVAIRKRFPRLSQDEHNDPLKFGYGVIGFFCALFIGFVVSSMWGQISAADAAVRTEGAAGVQLARDRSAFDPPDGNRIRHSLLDYARAAEAEWPRAARGESLPAANQALDLLSQKYQDVAPRTDAQKSFLATSLSNLDKFSKARTERIIEGATDSGPPGRCGRSSS